MLEREHHRFGPNVNIYTGTRALSHLYAKRCLLIPGLRTPTKVSCHVKTAVYEFKSEGTVVITTSKYLFESIFSQQPLLAKNYTVTVCVSIYTAVVCVSSWQSHIALNFGTVYTLCAYNIIRKQVCMNALLHLRDYRKVCIMLCLHCHVLIHLSNCYCKS